MKTLFRGCLFLFTVTLLGLAAEPASAQYPYGAGYYDTYYQAFYNRRFIDQLPPYFSQFPPVYYSNVIIPRPYGWSPFALRPSELNCLPPAEPEAAIIDNPYVEEQSHKPVLPSDTRGKSASVPRVIINPFVTGDSDPQIASTDGR
jgi:hypothetical protein